MMPKKEGFSKAFSRVKQKVDQNLGRAEATRPLSNESVEAERRISNVQKAMERFNKVTKEFSDQCSKPPEDLLVKGFLKNGEALGNFRDLGDVWLGAADVEKNLSAEKESLQSVLKGTIEDKCRHVDELLGNVRRMRKDLDNYILDMDSARRRYNQLVRQQGSYGSSYSSYGPSSQNADNSWSSNSASPSPPDHSAEVAAAWQKVECARDSLEAEMNEIIANEYVYGEVVVNFLEQQAKFHERSVLILKNSIPILRERLNSSVHRPVFGLPLSDHLRLWHRRISLVIEYCCLHLLKFGTTEEGLFRIGAGASKIRRLKAKFNSGQLNSYQWPPLPPCQDGQNSLHDSSAVSHSSVASSPDYILPSTDPNESTDLDIHAIAGVLKQYLRELPDPLLTSALCEEWTQAISLPEEERIVIFQALLSKLPIENYENLRYLVHFLSLLTHYSDQNRMTPSNVGIVIGPNIMSSSPRLGENPAASISANMQQPAIILQTFIENVDVLFPGRTAFKPESNAFLYQNLQAKGNGRSEACQNILSSNVEIAPRHWSNTESIEGAIEDSYSHEAAVVPNGEPSSYCAYLTDKNQLYISKNEKKSSHIKSLVPVSQSLANSPRIAKSIFKSFASKRQDESRKAVESVRSNETESDSTIKRDPQKAPEISTITAVRSATDMDISSGSIHLATFMSSPEDEFDIDENDETVAVLDTSELRRHRDSQKKVELADAASQRALRAEMRRIKSKELRTKFFADSSIASNASKVDEVASGTSCISISSIPKNVLIFPPMTDHSQSADLSKSRCNNLVINTDNSNNGDNVANDCENSGQVSSTAGSQDLPPPEHLAGQVSPDQLVPVAAYSQNSLNNLEQSSAFLSSKTSADEESRASSVISMKSSNTSLAGKSNSLEHQNNNSHRTPPSPAPIVPRRRPPNAPAQVLAVPPQMPPPPPPPQSPPTGMQPPKKILPEPLVPTVARPMRSAKTKTVAVSQTTPTHEFDPTPVNRLDSEESHDSYIITSL